MRCLFVTPALDGPTTGGTLYNQQLLAALADCPAALSIAQSALCSLQSTVNADQIWIDSLYLAAVPGLRERYAAKARVGLLLHYLPSLLHTPALRSAGELSELEQRALEAAELIVTPSAYMRNLVSGIYPDANCVCVMPGVRAVDLTCEEPGRRAGRALMICNVTENKGVLPFLHALAQSVPPQASFALEIAGSLALDPAYAQACLSACERHPWLRAHVDFVGSVEPEALFIWLAEAELLVSASRMESYGMALAEARAVGTPILALPGGNVASHVTPESGGQLSSSYAELAQHLCALMSDPAELRVRKARARATIIQRSWRAAALDFIAAANRLK